MIIPVPNAGNPQLPGGLHTCTTTMQQSSSLIDTTTTSLPQSRPESKPVPNKTTTLDSLQVPGAGKPGTGQRKIKKSKWYPNEKVVLRNFSHAKPGDRDWRY